MKKYQFNVHRTIGQLYKCIIVAESMDIAQTEFDEMYLNGELEFNKTTLLHEEVTEEFVDSIEEIK